MEAYSFSMEAAVVGRRSLLTSGLVVLLLGCGSEAPSTLEAPVFQSREAFHAALLDRALAEIDPVDLRSLYGPQLTYAVGVNDYTEATASHVKQAESLDVEFGEPPGLILPQGVFVVLPHARIPLSAQGVPLSNLIPDEDLPPDVTRARLKFMVGNSAGEFFRYETVLSYDRDEQRWLRHGSLRLEKSLLVGGV